MYKLPKYDCNRSLIKNGDVILFRGKSLLAKLIQYFDSSYFNHIGIAMECNGRLFIIDSNAQGVKPEFLSVRISEKKYTDFSILRINQSQENINIALSQVLSRAENSPIKYDFLLCLRVAISRKFGIELKKFGKENRDICSEWARRFTNYANVNCYKKPEWITPQDFKRFQNNNEISTILE